MLSVEHYPGGTLGKGPVQQLSMVENSVTDIAEVVVAYTPGRFPELSVFELPFLVENNVEAGLAAMIMYEDGVLSDFDELAGGLPRSWATASTGRRPTRWSG